MTKHPKEMDIRIERKGSEAKEFKAVYRFEGENLLICVNVGGRVRPAVFESKAGSGYRLITLKRVKE